MITIPLKPLSYKHKLYINRCLDNKFNVAEGAIRSGKTIDNCIAAAMILEITPDKIHLASGSTLANAKLNIGECNGFGLEHLFKGRCRWGKFKDNEALFIQTQTGEKVVIFVGGGKADSYKKILGNSYGLWIATESNEHYDSDNSKESFIKVAFGRQIASEMPKVLWDQNPSNPNDTIYTDYIDKWQENSPIGGYNYMHFTIDDNLAITEERRKEIESQYDPLSLWYQRDILGLRVVAEGAIYQEFKNHHILKISDWNKKDENNNYVNDIRKALKFITIGVDFGGNKSAHSFNATGFTNQFRNIITIKQKRISKKIDDVELTNEFVSFIIDLKAEYPNINIIDIRCDSAEQVLIEGFRRALREHNIGIPINNAIKGEIKNRIRFYCKMFSTNKYYILESCTALIGAFKTAIWEKDKVDIRLDDGKQDIDSLDAQEYSTEPYMNALVQIN